MFYSGEKLATRCVGSAASYEGLRGLGAVPDQPLPLSGPVLPGKSYKVICDWWLPVLDIEALERGCAANRAGLPTLLGATW